MKCPICYCNYTKEKPPYIFNCGHSFHIECILNIEKTAIEKKERVRCPTCRTYVSSINKNYLAIEMLNNEEDNSVEDVIEKYEEASKIYTSRLKECFKLKKEIKELKSNKDNIIESYTNLCKRMVNSSYIEATSIATDILNQYTNPFSLQIKNIKEERERLMVR